MARSIVATESRARAIPDATRRMMLERITYLFEAARVQWSLHSEHRGGFTVDGVLTSTPEAVTELALERLARAVHVIAPRYASALLRDESLVWRFPLGATFLRSPLTEEQREDEHLSRTLYHGFSPRNGVLWCVSSLNGSGFYPREFRYDPRASYEDEGPYSEDSEGLRAHIRRRERDEAEGVRMLSSWSIAWPPDVEVSRVCELLRASKAPEAIAVADDIRGTVFGGPNILRRLGARSAPFETPEQRQKRLRAVVCRWASAFDADGGAIPIIGNDLEEATPFLAAERGSLDTPIVRAPTIANAIDTAPRWLVDATARDILSRFQDRWSPVAVAHIADAIARVDHGQRTARMFALPAAQEPRVVFEMMARARTFEGEDVSRAKGITSHSVTWRVAWDGRPNDRGQISFAFAYPAQTADVFRDILSELGAEGLRDYAILHRMAAEQGRTGRFFWTWEAHKRATAFETRVRNSTSRDADVKKATLARIKRLRNAELHVEVVDGKGRRAWRVIGEAPLVFRAGGIDAPNGDMEGVELVLNPALYRTAASSEREQFFTQLPEAVLSLPALPFSLALMLAFRWRYAADVGGVITLPKAKLHEYMDAGNWRRGDAMAAAETLARALQRIVEAFGAGCSFEDLGDTVRATPSASWTAAVIDRVPPSLPPSTANRPRTGADLRAWREKRELSQTEAARVLGVGKRTIVRAEVAADAALPRAFGRATWEAAASPIEGES